MNDNQYHLIILQSSSTISCWNRSFVIQLSLQSSLLLLKIDCRYCLCESVDRIHVWFAIDGQHCY
ncbi:hypothetical protein ACJIZ3_014081 [Penstemon smallii]|uniref:Uncharacterized protein n=1 Tax=Penstemon smallii TaxID=265156 RepID=A0ABD3RIV3_9LAMI